MDRLQLAVAGLMLGVSAAAAAQDTNAVDIYMAERTSSATPGCSVAVSKDGRTVFSRAYGMADLERNVPITSSTRFDIGSVSKQFTAAAILLLAQEGKLSLEDDVRKHVPELPDYGSKITIDHLLRHTSGLREFTAFPFIQGWAPLDRREITADESLKLIFRQQQLNFQPGAAHSYSNTGYALAAEIIRRVSGQSVRSFLQQRLFDPLGMTSTELPDNFRQLVPNRAISYDKRGGTWALSMPRVDVRGAGGVISTAHDLLIWNNALDEGRLGQFVTAGLERQEKTLDGLLQGYARGVMVRRYKGVKEVGHNGRIGGYWATLIRYPDQRLSIAATCNGGASPEVLGSKLADIYLTGTTNEIGSALPPKTVNRKPEHLASLTGVFLDNLMGNALTVDLEHGALRFDGVTTAASADRFHLPSGATVVFKTRDLLELTRSDGGQRTARRIDGPPPTAAQLEALQGRYRSDEADVTYHAMVEDKKLVFRTVEGPGMKLDLDPISADIFRFGGFLFRFVRDSSGVVDGFLFSMNGIKDLRFVKLSPRKET